MQNKVKKRKRKNNSPKKTLNNKKNIFNKKFNKMFY